MAVTPYEEKKYIQSDAVTQAQQALAAQQAASPGEYRSQYQSGLDDLADRIRNREDFQYDVNADALYQQVAQNYQRQGRQAMMDTVGQAAALTGGYGNSYAQTAGQQAYQQYLLGLADLVPQYQQMAFQRYQAQGQDLLDRYGLLQQQEDRAYSRYQDGLDRYYGELDRLQSAYDNERSYDYSRFLDDRNFDYGRYTDQRDHEYRQERDQVADDQWLQQLTYQQERDRIADEQWQKEYDEMVRQYNQNYELSLMSKSGSKGSKSSGTVTAAAAPTYNDIKSDYIQATQSGASAASREAFLEETVDAGYITQKEADQIAAIYKAPTQSYTAVDQMWDRHS